MAEIDKALPNSKRTTIELPDQNQIQEELVQEINKEQQVPEARPWQRAVSAGRRVLLQRHGGRRAGAKHHVRAAGDERRV